MAHKSVASTKMQRKPGFPVANCSIKMPDGAIMPETAPSEEEWEPVQRRQQLINFGHSQWGFNNWSWSVSKQDLDFVDLVGGKYSAGVAAFVSVSIKSFDIHRENVGYATALAPHKGSAIHRARKCAVTNALRETLLSFGGSVATELMELLETSKPESVNPTPEQQTENNQNIANKQEPKNSPLNKNMRKDSSDSGSSANVRVAPPAIKNAVMTPAPPVAKAHPMPANLPPAANRLARPPVPPAAPPAAPAIAPAAPPHPPIRPNSNEGSKADGSEEDARAERKRRQRLAQEEFRQKQLLKQKSGLDERASLSKDNSSLDTLLMAIPTPDIIIEGSGNTEEAGKRKSPASDGGSSKRRGSISNKLEIVSD
ncbi:unnamed protein product [Parnassius apollo]|uniref:(apollo) hypothetical protein n=1 Tax=Parnassius apollo TaxID=110799 RepID=A0A8S3Y6V4_PARAO|nr:unnamed protein product [Parnassius apollo]